MKSLTVAAALSLALIATAGWSSPVQAQSDSSFASAPSAKTSSASTTSASRSVDKPFRAQKKIRITSRKSDFGRILFNRDRQAIYIFDREQTKQSKCYGTCAELWPPVLTKGKPKAKGKIRKGKLGTTKRKGGAVQVTYAGSPLYYYAHEGPGDVFCHDVFEFGGNWLVVHPNGKAAD